MFMRNYKFIVNHKLRFITFIFKIYYNIILRANNYANTIVHTVLALFSSVT